MSRKAINFVLLCLVGLIFFQGLAHAESQSPTLEVDGSQNSKTLFQSMDYYRDPSGVLTIEDILNKKSDEFKPLGQASPNFGFIEDRIWLRLNVTNTTDDVKDWVIHTQENFLQYYDIYLQRANDDIEILEQHRPNTPFSERKIAFPELVTPIDISPGENAAIFIAYSSGGSTNISLFFLTSESYAARSMIQTSKNFVSYGMMLILMVTAILALIILQKRVFFSYFLYVTITLLFLMHSDGVAFQYFWPNLPIFNSYFSIIVGLAFTMVPYDFARVFLRTKVFHPRIDKFMVFMLIAIPAVTIPLAFINPQLTKQMLMFLVFFGICAGTLAGFIAAIDRFREVRFYVFAWAVGAGSAAIMNLRHFTPVDISQTMELDSIRIAIVVDAIMLGLGVADRYIQNLKASRDLDKKSLQQAQQNLHLNERLFDLEQQFTLATELVETRDTQLKNTVHDLRQPLHALRLNVKKLQNSSQMNLEGQSDLDETFTYLETLIADHLQSSVTEDASLEAQHASQEESLDLPQILNSIYEMFISDAAEKNLDFRFVNTTQKTDIAPLIIMRIITNIVSNAIKYTSEGGIILGVRRTSNTLRIEVHDTGAGMTEEQFNRALVRGTRLKKTAQKTEGRGLGLNIANSLAEKNGLKLTRLTGRQTGTSIALEIPLNP